MIVNVTMTTTQNTLFSHDLMNGNAIMSTNKRITPAFLYFIAKKRRVSSSISRGHDTKAGC